MGIQTVAVHSTADRDSLHVRFADEAVCIGGPPPRRATSTSRGHRAAEITVDAIHPGYGFLAESRSSPRSARRATSSSSARRPNVIRVMGDKVEARRAMTEAGVPILPEAPTPVKSRGRRSSSRARSASP
jgi:acetyl-CoA carboxylase biotin carboxylase subunit